MLKIFLFINLLCSIVGHSLAQQNLNNMVEDIYNYKIAKAGKIQPEGWIKHQLHRDLTEGYIGRYDDVHQTVNHNVFEKQNRISKRKFSLRKTWWSGEHEGYWKDAVTRVAFLTNNEVFQKQAGAWMRTLLDSRGEDGYIGIYADCKAEGCRFNHVRGNGELWVTSRIVMAMLAYYEYTGDIEVFNAAEKSVQLIMEKYNDKNYFRVNSKGGGVSHGVGFFENLEWLYRITGKKEYLHFALKLYDDFNKGNVRDDDLQTRNLLAEERLFEKHGAHIAEGLFIPEFIAAIDQKEILDSAANNVIDKLEQHFTPGGAMRCDEWIKGRKGTADERYEYCGIAEMISPLSRIIAFTGNIRLADYIETMTFNAGQGSRFPVLKALSYLTTDNRIKIRHGEIAKRESYDAAHFAAACCALNGGRLMPYYVEGMWMANEPENKIMALLYGPSKFKTTINDAEVEIVEHTNYPFDDKINFKVNTTSLSDFSLVLRKPFNCQDIEWQIPEGANIIEEKDRLIIQNNWQNGDEVVLRFNFLIRQISQPASRTVKGKGVYIQRGPLVFALPFEHKIKRVKEYRNSGFYRYKIKAQNRKNWKLKINLDQPMEFIPAQKDSLLTPWDKPVVKLKVTLQNKRQDPKNYYLVPMGNTIFRRVTFPIANKN